MQAFERGEEIEVAYRGYDIWSSMSTPSWNFEDRNYRIKPKPKQIVLIEKWLLKMQGTEQYAIEEGSKEEMNTWGKYKTDAWQKVKLLETYEVEI